MPKETIATTIKAMGNNKKNHCSASPDTTDDPIKYFPSLLKKFQKQSIPETDPISFPKRLKESAGIKGVTNSKMDERKRNPDKMMLYFLKMKLVFMAIPFFEEITLNKIFILLKLYHKNLKTAILLRVLR
jgi:hypothetical protein